jgi:uncharacterized protein YdhG (YjbR/CyaY superfamily)
MGKSAAGSSGIDGYIAGFPEEVRERLAAVRGAIRDAAPDGVVETISYGMLTFKLNGRYLVYFAAYKQHIAVYPVPGGSEALTRALGPYVTGKGTLRFPLDRAVPLGLIKRVVKALARDHRGRERTVKPDKAAKPKGAKSKGAKR